MQYVPLPAVWRPTKHGASEPDEGKVSVSLHAAFQAKSSARLSPLVLVALAVFAAAHVYGALLIAAARGPVATQIVMQGD
jgi:hypothetical protein